MEHILFLTGRLAEPALRRVLEGLDSTQGDAPFTWEVKELGLQVAALMTTDMVRRRLPTPVAANRVVLPGRCAGDVDGLAQALGVPVERGPQELKDLPMHFKRRATPVNLDAFEVQIFAEIVDATALTVDQTLARARSLAADGADVIDLGCLPATPYPHLEDTVRALREAGFRVSVDSQTPDELLRGGRAGADFLLSLREDTLWVADEVASTPVLVPREPQDEASLWRCVEAFQKKGRAFLADPILDPLPFGFLSSLVRYHALRQRFPDAPILLGVGNLTELTEADTSGINALLLGVAAELRASAILTTQVSPHARRAVREADWARRIMHNARENRCLPKGLSDALMTAHDKAPFPDSAEEIAATAGQVRDPNFRVQVAEDGLHVYNRDGIRRGTDPFALWPQLGLQDDAGHAFYMGVELARAQTAWELGKRYVQDRPLNWGAAVERGPDDLGWCAPGPTRGDNGRKP
ncbi:dihydropteroate synthase-like enzyme [Burkholderiales bacterium JOSHI_001]|nr:dihydropteroate synthase-like enzyme [Burkholderiales bacterium JOSHI_001]